MAKTKKAPKTKRPVGRPTVITPAVREEICDRIAQGRTIRSVAEDPDMPDRKTMYRALWKDADFATAIARAREAQAGHEYDEFREVTDAVREGRMDPTAGKVVLWALTWRLSHMQPKTYGDKVDVEHGGTINVIRKIYK